VSSHGFHRQCQVFQLPSGPPCTHSTSGAGAASGVVSGSVSQDRTVAPSAAVAVTSVSEPGSGGVSTAARAVMAPSAEMRTGCGGAA
jgi:hypothetical protein